MHGITQRVAIGSAFALLLGSSMTGVASAAPGSDSLGSGSLGSGSLGSLAPRFTSPYTLADVPECTEANYFNDPYNMWEINGDGQYTEQRPIRLDSESYGGLTYIDAQYSGETPAETLAKVEEYNDDPANSQAYHWWYPNRDMVSNGAELTLGSADGDIVLGEVMVGNNNCPSVRWTHFPVEGEPETTTPDTFPEDAPAPAKPAIPSSDDSPMGSLGSLFGS